jgi:polysaccharide export outer membrane protein
MTKRTARESLIRRFHRWPRFVCLLTLLSFSWQLRAEQQPLQGIRQGQPADASRKTRPAEMASTAGTEYIIQPLDTLQINVFQEPDLSVKTRVTQLGTINYPLLGSVQVAGLTLPEAQKTITDLLGKDYLVHPQVNVLIERSSSRRVVVLGQVKSPGTYEILADETMTVLQAIARAGGFTDIAASDRVAIIHLENGKEQKIQVNVSAIIKSGDRSKDMELKPGDVVSVPETIF